MNKEVHIDEEDATILGRYIIPLVAIIILTLTIEQHWQSMDASTQAIFVVILFLIATWVYRDPLREMIFT